ncbi:24340_t:CDS:2, partial [Racocetra persica]
KKVLEAIHNIFQIERIDDKLFIKNTQPTCQQRIAPIINSSPPLLLWIEQIIEIWLPIADLNKLISNLGRIKNNKGVVLKGNVCKRSGYIRIDLSINSIYTSTGVHILVAQAFISNPENKLYVNHINSIKHDNRAVNLEWVTSKENAEHKIFLNRGHSSSRRIVQEILDGNVIWIWNSIHLAGNTLKVLENKISECCNRKQDTAGGWCWTYYENYIEPDSNEE